MLYLVKWPDGSAFITHAYNKDQLFDIIDQVGDPYQTTYESYRAELHIPIKAPTGLSCEIEFTEEMCDAFAAMIHNLQEKLYPEAANLREAFRGEEDNLSAVGASVVERDRLKPLRRNWEGYIPLYARK